jgi:deazaflavin-dependent oxidoreductase (nitroreductase family)
MTPESPVATRRPSLTGRHTICPMAEAGPDLDRAQPARTRLRRFAPLTTQVVNPIALIVAGRLPGFAILTHVGRRTGRRYRTPLMVFRRGDEFDIALGSGSDVQWVRNVVAAGGGALELQGRHVQVMEPTIRTDPTRQSLPWPLRRIGSAIGLTEFLALRERPERRSP